MKVNLPSGSGVVVNPLARPPVQHQQESVSSNAMILEMPGICPKCGKQMGIAYSGGEQTFYCQSDRVCLPLPIAE